MYPIRAPKPQSQPEISFTAWRVEDERTNLQEPRQIRFAESILLCQYAPLSVETASR
jgi:hypothetical protein